MRQSKLSETQIVSILEENDAGRPVNEIWRTYGISSATYYKWKTYTAPPNAARAGFPVLYVRAPRLFESLQQARADGSHLKLLTKLGKLPVLILDDLLLTPLTDAERKDLLEIVEDRYGTTATVITSQCPLKEWHRHMGDPTLADAICDRLLHTAYKIELKGESIRKATPASRPGADA
jgi:DNA replication protein DnaC